MLLMMYFLQDKPNTEFQPAYPNGKEKALTFHLKKRRRQKLHLYESNNMFIFFKNNFSL